MFKIYLDMDGVIADFHTYFYKRLSELGIARKEDGKFSKEHYEAFSNEVKNNKLFEKLDLLVGGQLLLDVITMAEQKPGVTVEMLTAAGSRNENHVIEVKRQKQYWLNRHGIKYKLNVAPVKALKVEYVKSNKDILIDDTAQNIDDWNAAGGIGILWDNTQPFESAQKVKRIFIEKGVL